MRAIVLALLVAAGVASPIASAAESDAAQRFRALHEREWQWRLTQSPMLASAVGVHDDDDKLDHVDEKTQQQRLAHLREALKDADALPHGDLTGADAINYAIFREQIASAIANIELRGYLMPLNSDSAFYTDLAYLPQQLTVANATDVRHYIARLREIPRYFDEQTALMREGLRRGMTVPRVVLTGRDKALDGYIVDRPEDSGFYAPLRELPAAIAADEAEKLRADARDAIAKAVVPAYAKLREFLRDDYIPNARTTLAAHALPDGKRYYAQQIRDYVTLDLMPDAIHQTGRDEVARIRAEMETVKVQAKFDGDFAAFLTFLRTDPQFYAPDAETLLMRAAWVAKRVDAQLPRFFGHLPRQPFGIAPVPDAIAPFYTSGRYVPPATGSDEPGYYWVNTYDLKSRTLYTLPALTLHEAVPGHHLQGALAAEQGEQPPFRRFNYISAYGEGWALYAEHLGDEMGIYRTPYEQFGRLTYEMWRACRLVVDTGVHVKGWTREQALTFMRDNTALSLHEIETEVDRYISWPGQALSYKLGELKIRELRARAEKALGTSFDLRAFHDAVLETGSVPLPVLEAHIDAWIAKRKAAPAN
jgi:uncharacterized protein (DUF885 family)